MALAVFPGNCILLTYIQNFSPQTTSVELHAYFSGRSYAIEVEFGWGKMTLVHPV